MNGFDFGRAMKQGYKTFRYFEISSKFWLFGNRNMASFYRGINKKSVPFVCNLERSTHTFQMLALIVFNKNIISILPI